MVRNLRIFLASIGVALLLIPAIFDHSAAATGVGPSVEAWVKSINASPGWIANMRGLSVDEENRTAVIENIVIVARGGGIVVEVEDARLSGFAEGTDGGFAAASLEIEWARVKTHNANVVLTDIDFGDIGVPILTAVVQDKWKPFGSMIAAYSALSKIATGGGTIARIDVFETIDGNENRISYENIRIGHVADGKIDQVAAGPLTLHSPTPNPLAEFTIASVEAEAIDLDAFVHIYDPLRYIAGVGDGIWRQAIGDLVYSDIVLTLPGVGLTFGAISVEDFNVRQPLESFAPLIEATMAERKIPPAMIDALASRYLTSLASTFGVGRFAINDIELAATGIDQLTLEELKLSDLSSDGFGEIALEGFIGAIPGQGAIAIGRFALGDIVFPSFAEIDVALGRAKRGADIDFSALTPKFGLVEAIDVNIQAIDFPGLLLGRMQIDLGNYLGDIPTDLAVDIEDLEVATSSLRPDRLRTMIASLGYDRIRTDAKVALNWREDDETISLDDFQVNIEEFGNTSAKLVLGGLSRQAIESPDDIAGLLADLTFERASVTFEDKSVVERSLSMRAELLNIPLDRLRQQLAGALPLMLAFVGNPELIKEIVPVLQTFIKNPGTLAIEAKPDEPVPVAVLIESARRRPQSLPGMLAIEISGTAGPKPENDSPAPEKIGVDATPPPIGERAETEGQPAISGSKMISPAPPP